MDQEILAFLEICRCKSISKAAEKLFISQSSLSTKIRILERKLGYSLFIRGKGSRSVMLTDKGRIYFGGCQWGPMFGKNSDLMQSFTWLH